MKGQQQIQQQKQLSAYSRKVTHDIFHDTMEFLEKYIEIAGYYPDWQQRKQIRDNPVVRSIDGSEDAEECFSIVLLGLNNTLRNKPGFLREEVKQEFYKWISATGVDVNNCHPRLKQVLFGFNEILEGRGKKIIDEVRNSKSTLDVNSPEYARELSSFFASVQTPLRNEVEVDHSLEGKTYKDIEIGSKFGGNIEQGKQAFGRIAEGVSSDNYRNFNFFPQQDEQGASRIQKANQLQELRDAEAREADHARHFGSSSQVQLNNPQQTFSAQTINWDLIIDIGQNKNDWEIKPIVTSHNYVAGRWYQGQPEQMLIHRTAKVEYNQANGDLLIQPKKMYKIKDFNDGERAELEQIFGSFQASTTSANYDQKTSFYQSKLTECEESCKKQKDNKGVSVGILAIVGVVSAVVIASVIIVKKQLNKKVKKQAN